MNLDLLYCDRSAIMLAVINEVISLSSADLSTASNFKTVLVNLLNKKL
jgi:hypothetical protein